MKNKYLYIISIFLSFQLNTLISVDSFHKAEGALKKQRVALTEESLKSSYLKQINEYRDAALKEFYAKLGNFNFTDVDKGKINKIIEERIVIASDIINPSDKNGLKNIEKISKELVDVLPKEDPLLGDAIKCSLVSSAQVHYDNIKKDIDRVLDCPRMDKEIEEITQNIKFSSQERDALKEEYVKIKQEKEAIIQNSSFFENNSLFNKLNYLRIWNPCCKVLGGLTAGLVGYLVYLPIKNKISKTMANLIGLSSEESVKALQQTEKELHEINLKIEALKKEHLICDTDKKEKLMESIVKLEEYSTQLTSAIGRLDIEVIEKMTTQAALDEMPLYSVATGIGKAAVYAATLFGLYKMYSAFKGSAPIQKINSWYAYLSSAPWKFSASDMNELKSASLVSENNQLTDEAKKIVHDTHAKIKDLACELKNKNLKQAEIADRVAAIRRSLSELAVDFQSAYSIAQTLGEAPSNILDIATKRELLEALRQDKSPHSPHDAIINAFAGRI